MDSMRTAPNVAEMGGLQLAETVQSPSGDLMLFGEAPYPADSFSCITV
jgi:hypothetical protein